MCTEKELSFVVFVINKLSHYLNIPVAQVYMYLSESEILDDYIIGCYEALHTLGAEYLIEDLTELMKERGVQL